MAALQLQLGTIYAASRQLVSSLRLVSWEPATKLNKLKS